MRARRADSPASDGKPDRPDSIYTRYMEMNELLNRFVKEARNNGIRVSVDAEEIREHHLGSTFCTIIQEALDTAKAGCIDNTSLMDRYIKIRSMDAQNQTFVKILYSCEGPPHQSDRSKAAEMIRLVEDAGGYIKINSMQGNGCIRIATPN